MKAPRFSVMPAQAGIHDFLSPRRPCPSKIRSNGFALLIVLWVLVFLAFLMTQILGRGRTAIDLAGNIRAAAQSSAADDGAIQTAIFHLLLPITNNARWTPGATYPVAVGAIPVNVSIATLDGQINPNLASQALLDGLLQAVGLPPDQANDLANAIIAWRTPATATSTAAADAYHRAGLPYAPPGTNFASIGELSDVIGMTPDILARIRPHLSLYQPGDPDPAAADPIVTKAMSLASAADPNNGDYEGAPVVTITACAPPPAPLCRRAIASLPGLNAQTPYKLLALENGDVVSD